MPENTPDTRPAMNALRYHTGNDLDLDQVIALYRASTLGERRPVDDREAMAAMLRHANLVVTAWNGDQLVGIARTLTDFAYVGYLSDLAVHSDFQRAGIGKELIRRTREQMGPKARIVLLAAPAAVDYYPRIGFTRHTSAWVLQGTDPFPGTAPARKD
ncbi:MAG: Acetyltransferase family protein [Bacteroidetes bacterium]|nr:Acetyltransferase family protein [Bacteroidota bacterium]